MSDTNQTLAEKANALKEQAAEKLGELKRQGRRTDGQYPVKSRRDMGHKLNSDETKESLQHLKDEATVLKS